MEKRNDESHVEYANRAMEAGEPDTTVEWTQTMSAAWVSSIADVYPDGTSIQDLMRAAAIARVMSHTVEDELDAACEDGEIEGLTASVEKLTGAINGLASED